MSTGKHDSTIEYNDTIQCVDGTKELCGYCDRIRHETVFHKNDLGELIRFCSNTCRNNYMVKEGSIYNEGVKHDDSKLRFDLIPPEVTEELARVLTYGAEKYSDNNWQKVSKDRYIAALYRHLNLWQQGEECDKESNLKHLSHALTNISFLLWKEINNSLTND